MKRHCLRLAIIIILCALLGSPSLGQYTFPPQFFDDVEAVLTVAAARHTDLPGIAELTLTLSVQGPTTLEVEEPRLGDAAAAWKEQRRTISRVVQNQRTLWTEIIQLKQLKRGIEPAPDVSLRFRRGTDTEWAEAKWVDVLRHTRDVPGPPLPEEPPSWMRRWGFALVLAMTAVLVILAWKTKRRLGPHPVALSPEQWAVRELEHVETTLLPPHGDAETYHVRLSDVVRRYLSERYGFHALQQTTMEFLDAVRLDQPSSTLKESPLPLSEEQRNLLGEFFARCDRAKFARADASAEECLRTTGLAREIVAPIKRA